MFHYLNDSYFMKKTMMAIMIETCSLYCKELLLCSLSSQVYSLSFERNFGEIVPYLEGLCDTQ